MQSRENHRIAETLVPSVFSSNRKNMMRAAARLRGARVIRAVCARQQPRSSVDARSGALHHAKTLVFLSRCSNPNAVFAIPAGTGRHRHSLRLGGQHGEETKEDGEGSEEGRKEDQAPEEEVSARRASVFDFERRR